MLVRRYVLLDDERDADLLEAIDGAANKAEAMRALMRGGLNPSPPTGGGAALEDLLRRVVREELAGLGLAPVQPVAAGDADEQVKAQLRLMFGSVGAGGK